MGIYKEIKENIDSRGSLNYRRAGINYSINYNDLIVLVERFSAGLLKLGLKKGYKVGIVLRNSPEWVIIDLACLNVGVIVVPIHFNSSKEEIHHIIKDSSVKLVFSSSKISGARNIVLKQNKECEKVLGNLLTDGIMSKNEVYNSDVATICYTSGSTGVSKGVILTHENILFNIKNQPFKFDYHDRIISYLPLSHMFERSLGYYAQLYNNVSIYLTEDIRNLAGDAEYFKPTLMLAVPRVLNSIYFKATKKKVTNILIKTGLGRVAGFGIKKKLGGKLRLIVCGGAQLDLNILKFYKKIGMKVFEGYGLTETSPLISTNYFGMERMGSAGKPIRGVKVRIDKRKHILVKGPGLFRDYTKKGEKRRRMINGWFDTNDLGYVEDGFIYISGRADDLIVLSSGKKVYPEPIEKKIEINGIDHAFVYGRDKPYLVALIYSEDKTKKEISKIIDKINLSLSNYEKVRKYILINGSLSPDNGTLTPTLKKIRNKIIEKHSIDIEELYNAN